MATADLTTLRALKARVEGLSGPDRETDALLWAEFDGRDTSYNETGQVLAKSRRGHDTCWLGTIDPGREQRNFRLLPLMEPYVLALTSSVDALLALIEREMPGWNGTVSFGPDGKQLAALCSPVIGVRDMCAWALTPALALLSAFLSALIAREPSDG